MIPFKKIFHSSLFAVNIVASILLLMSAFSDIVSPERMVAFSFLGMGFPFILIINIIFVVWWLMFAQWKKCLVCLACIVLCGSAIKAYFPIHLKTESIPEDCIKVLTYNVMSFHHCKPHSKKSPNPVLQYIIDSEADIVCIQEHRTYQDNYHLSANDLKSALKMYPYSHIHRVERAENHGVYGLSIYSKFPITSTEKIKFNSVYNGAFKSELNINGKQVTLINCHLETNSLSDEERKQYDDMIKSPDSKKLDAVAGQAVKKLKPAFKAREMQANQIAEVLKNDSNLYQIVCGDFNDTPISYARRTIKGNMKDAFAETGCGFGITYNQNSFYFRIDYILHSQNIESYNCSVGDLKDSDHYPVYTWLRLKD